MFKKGIAFITAVALVTSGIVFTPSNADASVNSNQGSNSWKLVWSDEFNQTVGQAPDTSVWNYDIGHGSNGWGNNELQRYTDSTNNVYIADLSSDSGSSDGRALAIKAQKEGSEYTSGRIQTQNKQYCKFGRIETKLRVENGSQSGVWPAFWMLGQNYNASGNNWNGAYGASPWPSCGEIDIMEHRNAETQVIGTLHWNPSTTNYEHVYAGSETTKSFGAIDTIENWHTYAIEWYEDCMKWYVDGICYQTMNISSEQMDEFQRDHFIILNLALGSNSSPFTLNQTVSANFTNATMYVDYVRVFQGNNASFSIKNKKEGITQPETTTNRFSSMTSINNDGNMHNIGQWNYLFAGSWTGTSGYYKGGTDLNDLEVYIGSNNNTSEEWGAQLKTNALSLNAGKTYNYSISLESDKAGAEVLLKNDTDGIELQRKTLTNGKNVFAGTITSEKGNAELIFALGKVAAGTTLKVTDFTISDSSGEITTKVPETTTKIAETTTKKPEQTTNKQEQTTKAPETTTKKQEQTTKAPETTTKKQEQTTKAPETTQPSKVSDTTKADNTNQSTIQQTEHKCIVSVGNTKVIKKKSLKKKIKLTVKKAANAKGYVVQYSTSKKFTKKTTKTINVAKTTVVLKKLKSNKKYYIRVRGYAVSNDEKVYGKWSAKISAKSK